MIPMIHTETTAKTALADLSTVAATPDETMPLFADMFVLGEDEAKIAAAAETAPTLVDGEVLEALTDQAILTAVSETDPKLGNSDVLGVGAVQSNGALAEKAVSTGMLLHEPKRSLDGVVSNLVKTPTENSAMLTDRAVGIDAKVLKVHPSVTQSAIESQLPSPPAAKAASLNSEIVNALPQTPLAKSATGDSTLAVIDATKPMPQQSPHATAANQAISLPEPRAARSARDGRGETIEMKATTPTLPGQSTPQSSPPPAVTLAKTLLVTSPDVSENLAKSIDAEVSFGVSTSDRNASILSVTGQTVLASGAETARHVAPQIAAAVTNHPNKTTEIALNPEELGRVRLSMTTVDGALTLHVVAERPETQDLLRRHIDVLAQEFRDLGYDTVSFSFEQDGQADADQDAGVADEQVVSDIGDNQPTRHQEDVVPTSGLDLRL